MSGFLTLLYTQPALACSMEAVSDLVFTHWHIFFMVIVMQPLPNHIAADETGGS